MRRPRVYRRSTRSSRVSTSWSQSRAKRAARAARLRLDCCHRRSSRLPFRAIPHDTGKSLERHQPFTQISPLRHLFNGQVIARLPAGTGFEQGSRHIHHVRRTGALIANRRAAAGAKAAGRGVEGIFKSSDLPACNAKAAPPAADVSCIGGAVGKPARGGMVVPGPAGGKIDFNVHIAAQALPRHACRTLCNACRW
jgi:hypothetical protein